jgi:hypothetical protein
MDDEAFRPGTPEVEINRKDGMPAFVSGERGKMGLVVLTNDRIVFTDKTFGGATGNIIGDLAGSAVQAHKDKMAGGGGPRELVRLGDLRGGRLQRRRLIPNLYELTLADGSTFRTHRRLHKKWDQTIRRLLSERHAPTVTDDGDSWHAVPA